MVLTLVGLSLLALGSAFASALPHVDGDGGAQAVLQSFDVPRLDAVKSIPGLDRVVDITNHGFTYESQGRKFELVQHELYESHQLRITEPTICDPSVQQYSGYLDIADNKHLFFWFFEARHEPETAPLMLWLNGGPGASTMASGLLFEHGPCTVPIGSNDTVRNPYSWNEHLNIIYLDQPVGTGYSYGAETTLTLAALADDVFAFLQLWLRRFPAYAARALHLAGESWGGHYVPHIGAHVHAQNGRLVHAPRAGQVRVPLASVALGNGLTDPRAQLASTAGYLCGGAPVPPFAAGDPRCAAFRAAWPPCGRMIDACYRFQNNATCAPATVYCWGTVQGMPLVQAGKNPYDLRRDCSSEKDGDLCYPELEPIAHWLNLTSTKLALGVDPALNFAIVNSDINTKFYQQGQAMLPSMSLLPELVNDGIRLLAYAGDVDGMCNYMGIESWMTDLDHKFHPEFKAAPSLPWKTDSGQHVGQVRVAGHGAGNVTFVRIFNAGHLAPFDQPEATLDMITRWTRNEPFV